jgi:hypothetical protein
VERACEFEDFINQRVEVDGVGWCSIESEVGAREPLFHHVCYASIVGLDYVSTESTGQVWFG